jgi:sulfotransferase
MEKTIFYNSSLPRAGSTLISNIIAQNPNFYCTPTSGLADLIINGKGTYNQSQAFQAQDRDEMESAFITYAKFGMQGYFQGITDKEYILDKSREWGINYGLLNMIQDSPKIICMVRDVRAIYASMEKNFRKNPHRENHVQNPPQLVGTTLDKRIDIWADGIPIGIALDRLKDIHQQGLDKNILFIRYEDLMSNPENEMDRIYDYLNIGRYKHTFDKITQVTQENDVVHGIYGDHVLREEFKMKPNDFEEVLGYEICQKIKNTYQWFFDKFGYV